MSNRSKQKGSKAERDVVEWLRGLHWPHARRLVLGGSKDPGDVALGDGIPVTVEVKDCAAFDLSGWLREAHTERDNNGHAVGVVVFKRRGYGKPGDWYSLMDGATLAHLLHRAGYLPGFTAHREEIAA